MDDDEAFLYGDDAPNVHLPGLLPATCLAGPPVEAHSPLPPPPNQPLPSSLISAPPSENVPSSAEKPPPSFPANQPDASPPLENEPPSSAAQPEPLPFHHAPDPVVEPEAGDDDAEGQEIDEDSEDDLDIILEDVDASHDAIPPPSRNATIPPSKSDTPRDSLGPRVFEQPNVTTEYKPLERSDFKPPEHLPTGPLVSSAGPSRTQLHHHTPSIRTHNRVPTPENFPTPATPPLQPAPDAKPPDIENHNPRIPSGYEDRDGKALMDFDFDAIPENERGWKKPGAHLADWFNYGFDETTWRLYVMKQKRLRQEEGWLANPFAAFATGNIQQAWDQLPSDLRTAMMQTIMGNGQVSVNNGHQQQIPPAMPPMMVVNPMMQGMEMGGYGMPGMQPMMSGGNGQLNGGNPGMSNQISENLDGAMKQDPADISENDGDAPAQYREDIEAREHQRHDQQRMQDQMRHMQHMQHMGIGPAFMPGMELAAMFGNQDQAMYLNAPQYNGMLEMPQMSHMTHMQPRMAQPMIGGTSMNMGMAQGMKPSPKGAGMNPGLGGQLGTVGGQVGGLAGLLNNSPAGPSATASGPSTNVLGSTAPVNTQTAGASSPAISSPAIPVTGAASFVAPTPNGSPRAAGTGAPVVVGRGRGRGGRGRGNAPASAFLAAAAARGRGRVISASNSAIPMLPTNPSSSPGSTAEVPQQVTPAVTPAPASASSAAQVAEGSPERPTPKPVSPLPSNVPTGPRRALPVMAGPPPRGPRVTPAGYFDKDAAGARGEEGLDYGGGGVESPRDDHRSASVGQRLSYREEREKMDEDPRAVERREDRSERSRSKSREKDGDDKETSHRSSRSKHRHRARSRSRDTDHRSGREKEDANLSKSGKSASGSRRSRRGRRVTDGDDNEERREQNIPGEEREQDKEKDKERTRDEDEQADYSAPAANGSRKRKPKEERPARSKRERAD